MVPSSSGLSDVPNGNQAWMFYLAPGSQAGGATSITATFSSSVAATAISFQEWSGIQSTTPLDQSSLTNIASSSTPTGTAVITTASGELCFAGICADTGGPTSQAAGTNVAWTLRNNDTTNFLLADESFVQAAAGSIAAQFVFGAAQGSQIGIMTFKAAAAGVVERLTEFKSRTFPVKWNLNAALFRTSAQDTSSFGVETNPHWVGKPQPPQWNISKGLYRNPATDVPFVVTDTPVYFIQRPYPVQWSVNKALWQITAQDFSSFGVETNPHWLGKPWPVAWSLRTLLQNSAADVPVTAVETNPHWVGKTYPVQWSALRALLQNTPTDVFVSAIETNIQFIPRSWPSQWSLQASLLRGIPQDFSSLPPATQPVYARYGASHGIGALSAIPGEIPS
jgi:hypothetical protein